MKIMVGVCSMLFVILTRFQTKIKIFCMLILAPSWCRRQRRRHNSSIIYPKMYLFLTRLYPGTALICVFKDIHEKIF